MRKALLALLLVPVALSAQPRAKNVILFLADAGGLATISAASLHGYGAPRRLYVQRMPHIGLSDTGTRRRAGRWLHGEHRSLSRDDGRIWLVGVAAIADPLRDVTPRPRSG
jgi:hypothetical protein